MFESFKKNKMDINYKLFYIRFLFCNIFFQLPSTTLSFGYDSATSCNPKMSRQGRAQMLASIPCDLTQQAYCHLPGSSYPWHAVRRFVHENQGLMRRMYGDVRHISILRTEIKNNDIDVEDIEETAARYSRDGSRKRKFLHSDYQNSKTNDVLTEPHFRPASTTTSTTAIAQTSISTTTPKTTTLAKINNIIDINEKNEKVDSDNSSDNNIESNSISFEGSTQNPNMENIKVVQAPNLNPSNSNKTESVTISTTLRVVQQIIKSEIESEKDAEMKPQIPDAELIHELDERIDENIDIEHDDMEQGTINVKDSVDTKESAQSLLSDNINKANESFNDKKKLNRPEEQLFQDTVQKEVPIVNARGVNACPVKEEVVAPFWANNTRGEVLALLNLYPFEQYVHWEKCTHEHKQMYCRDGCRCEQQYRLHRLLAYDPNNECRGIFSDWFRFPSCCICKCYDIPLEFRATSRSPRTSALDDNNDHLRAKHSMDLAEDDLQKAIYEHATEEWYRPREEFDFYD